MYGDEHGIGCRVTLHSEIYMALDLMQIATYIPWLALVVSALSLAMSIRNSSFSRRTKLIELKVAFLSKLSESSMANKRLHRLNQEFRRLASDNDDGPLRVPRKTSPRPVA